MLVKKGIDVRFAAFSDLCINQYCYDLLRTLIFLVISFIFLFVFETLLSNKTIGDKTAPTHLDEEATNVS